MRARRIAGIDTDIQVHRLARAVCQETDAAAIELGFATPEELIPWEKMNRAQQAVYEGMAKRLYDRLAFNGASGHVVVIEKG